MSTELIELTKKLGIDHTEKKRYESGLKADREKFFRLATFEIERKGSLKTKVVTLPNILLNISDREKLVEKYHPGWRPTAVIGQRMILEEDPALLKFTFVNPEDKKVYFRNAIQSDQYLDDDALQKDHPDIWDRITVPVTPPWEDVLIEFGEEFLSLVSPNEWSDYVYSFTKGKMSEKDWPRELLDFAHVSPDDLAIIQDYLVPGPITLRLEPPRDAKPEELE